MKKWIWGLLGLVIVVGGWLVYSNSTSSKTKNENVTTSQSQKSSSSKKKATTSSKKEASSSSRKIATMASSKKIDKSTDTTLNGTLEAGLKPIDFSETAVLIDNDKIVDSYTAGDANNDKKVKNTLTTTYEIDSLQKALTAGLVMNQINAGKLQFTDKLSKYIKDFPGGDQITIRQLLDMTSGLSMGDVTYKEANLSNSQLLKVVRKNVKFDANKIGTWNYQPVNFVILSEVIERVSGRSYEQLFNNTYVQNWV
ncbi:serine hydrolase domain-containing protein [Pediococcus stilesii]|uniref:Beta-lactamase n=1 Tax=Pediococcus stilesii TaxID=331679 RepID=A0A0R2KUZ7_9LACO|nr:serine hydrolase domain-containing protein [Pediococcus stilesii]KRN93257.1 beta-lactamase [Pediococcus stilesii]